MRDAKYGTHLRNEGILQLWVKVRESWLEEERALMELGY